jgi:hypothetical protein
LLLDRIFTLDATCIDSDISSSAQEKLDAAAAAKREKDHNEELRRINRAWNARAEEEKRKVCSVLYRFEFLVITGERARGGKSKNGEKSFEIPQKHHCFFKLKSSSYHPSNLFSTLSKPYIIAQLS